MNRRSLMLVASLTFALVAGTAPGASAASPDAAPRFSTPNAPNAGPFAGTAPAGPFDAATAERKLNADLAAIERQLNRAGITLPSLTRELRAAGRAATELRQSLSASQKAQLAAVLDKSSIRVNRILDQALSSRPATGARGQAPGNIRDVSARLNRVSATLDRQVRGVLSAEQRASHRTAIRPAAVKVAATGATSAATPTAAITPQTLSSSCYYGAYYEQLALYYKYYGYLYAYYNYITYGGTYAYNGYLYSYYAYYYGQLAAPLLAQTYFEYLTTGSDWLGIGDNGTYYAYYDYYYAYYGYLYNYYSYYYNGNHSYAYYAYLYEYYARSYGYTAYYYAYYYCQ